MEKTTEKYPDLEDESFVKYQPRSADAFIQPG
jgi:hypothetical protein